MKQFIAGLTLGIMVTGAVLRAQTGTGTIEKCKTNCAEELRTAEFKLPEGSGGVPGPFVPGQIFSFVPVGVYMSPPPVECSKLSPEALEQIRKAVRP